MLHDRSFGGNHFALPLVLSVRIMGELPMSYFVCLCQKYHAIGRSFFTGIWTRREKEASLAS